MKNILNHKAHLTTKVSVLTLLLLLSIAIPFLALPASAAGTVSLSPTSGPNGTRVTPSGTGFGISESSSALTIAVNGLSGKVTSSSVATNSAGNLTGSFVIGGVGSLNLAPGTYSVQISDSVAAPPAVSFTITAPTVTLAPSTGPAGTSVLITASGFGPTPNQIISATFAGTTIYALGSLNAFSGTVTSTGTATTGGTLALAFSSIAIANTTNTLTGTITPSSAWTANGTLTGTYTAVLTGSSSTASVSSFSGSVPFADIGTTNVETVTVTLTLASFAKTSSSATLSSNTIASGSYSATVSLPAIVTGSSFTLTDNYGNVGTATYTLNVPTVTLSPTSGPVGTQVIATVTGFGPGASVASVKIGNAAPLTTLSIVAPTTPIVTEQGTSAFIFTVTTGTLNANFASGAQTITVTDSLNDVATSAFTITPAVTMTLGVGSTNSGVAYAPTGTANVVSFFSASGFKPSSVLTITASPGVPAGWTSFLSSGYQTVVTDATGSLGSISNPIVSGTGTAPSSGIYSVTVSDGTNTVTILLTITSTASFFIVTPSSGASGTTVTLTGFGGTSSAINFDGLTLSATQCTGNAWPNVPTTSGSFTVPASGAGVHTITATGITGSAAFTNTGAPIISVVSPSSAGVGTIVTIVGSGFAKATGVSLSAFSIDSLTVPTTSVTFTTSGAMVATFMVPAFLPTTHSISVTDSFSNTASATFTSMVSSVTVTPISGVVSWKNALPLLVTGSGFPMNQPITVTFSGVASNLPAITTGLSTTNTNGGILIFNTSIPATTITTVAGTHTITVSAGTAAATATFTVNANITLSTTLNINPVTAVRAPAVVPISGAGFAGSSALTISLGGTAATWFDIITTANTTSITTDASGNIVRSGSTSPGVIIPATTASGPLSIAVTDASGNTATVTLTILGTPSLTLGATQVIAGLGTVTMTGSGYTPGTRAGTVSVYQGTTLVQSAAVSPTVTSSGALPSSFGVGTTTFAVPNAAAGSYTVNLTLATPSESAIATFIILGAPTLTTSPTSGRVGANVTITVVGLSTITTATMGGALSALTLNATSPPTTGANAYNLTASFLVPSIAAGTYTILLADGTRSATALFTVTTSMTLSPTIGILKGSTVSIAGTGFAAAGTAFNVTVNGLLLSLAAGTTGTGGTVSTSFAVPLTAITNNTVVVMDTAGNNATGSFVLTAPTIALSPTSGSVGSTVQLLGSGFTANSAIIVEVGSSIVTAAPTNLAANSGGSFIAYITIPSGLVGNQTIMAIDTSNNVATATFAVTSTGPTTFQVNQAALSSSAQTLNSAGAPATSFPRGSTVKLSFVLDTTTGSGSVVWRITLQQGTAVYNIATTTASISTTPNTLTYTQLIPTGIAAGTWTASIQIFQSDGLTPLGVATLTFNVT